MSAVSRIALGMIALLLLLTADARAETWVSDRGGSDGNPLRESDPTPHLGTAWATGDSMLVPEGGCVSYRDGTVYTPVAEFGSLKTRPSAFDAEDGSLLWQMPDSYWSVGCMTPHGDKVLVTYRTTDFREVLALLDSDDGSVVWEHELSGDIEFQARQGVTVADGKVFAFVRGYSGMTGFLELLAIDLDNGEELWSRPGTSDWTPPLAGGGVVLVPGIVAYDTDDGTNLDWATSPADDLAVSVIRNGTIFYRRDSRYVQARDLGSGQVLWTRDLGGSNQVSDLVADGENVYVAATSTVTRLSALDQSDGSDVWPPRILIDASPHMAMLGGRLFLRSDTSGGRAIFDPSTGDRIGSGSGFPEGLYMTDKAYGDGSFFYWRRINHPLGGAAGELAALREVTPPEIEITSPHDGRYQADNHQLTWTATDGSGVGIEGFEVRVNGQLRASLPAESRSYQLTDLSAGANEISLTGIDLNGNKSTLTRQITVVPSPIPVARILVLDEVWLSGKEVQLSAYTSHDTVLDGGIVKYEWDVDGDGEFEFDAGANETVRTSPTHVGEFDLGLKVTNKSGNSATAVQRIDVRRSRLPGAGHPGVSINDAAIFTNDPNVKLRISWPDYAKWVTFSNDGGFPASQTQSVAIPESGVFDWKLNSSGPERLPKQVYMRFWGGASDSVAYTDDIILDQTPPVIELASVTGVAGASVASAGLFGVSASAKKKPKKSKKRKKPKRFRVRLKARDGASGVVAVQVAKNRRARGPVVRVGKRARRISKVINPRVKYRPRLIRAKDAAGNWSKFRRVK